MSDLPSTRPVDAASFPCIRKVATLLPNYHLSMPRSAPESPEYASVTEVLFQV